MNNDIKKKRIGVLTMYYNSVNYGGLLQAYALVKYLNNNGYDARQVRYDFSKKTININIPDEKRQRQIVIKIKKCVKSFLESCNNIGHGLIGYMFIRQEACRTFRDSIPHTNEIYSVDTLKNTLGDFDVFITGSDQVWNPNGYRPGFFLTFVNGKGKTKIAYAASISNQISDSAVATFKADLKDFTTISVREKSDVEIIKKITNKSVKWALDPVFLLDREEWALVSSDIKDIISEKYIFCYFLGDSGKQRKIVEDYAKYSKLKIVTIPYIQGNYRKCDRKFGDVRLQRVTPNQFLGLIRSAECVFTDSFHATAFSLIFRKAFVVFERNGHTEMIERIKSITQLFNCSERLVAENIMSIKVIIRLITEDYLQCDSEEMIRLLKDSQDILKI